MLEGGLPGWLGAHPLTLQPPAHRLAILAAGVAVAHWPTRERGWGRWGRRAGRLGNPGTAYLLSRE